MAKWLFKSEPDVWGWNAQVAKGDAGEEWGGVRNYQARNNKLDEAGTYGYLVQGVVPASAWQQAAKTMKTV